MWRTYQDSIGSWGTIAYNLPEQANLSACSSINLLLRRLDLKPESASFADQSLMITGRMEVQRT